jgi:hypothetical protein
LRTLVDESDQCPDDVVEPVSQGSIDVANITDGMRGLEIGDRLSSRTKRIVIASATTPATATGALGDIERDAHTRTSELSSMISIEASDLVCQRPNVANHLKANGIDT